MPPQMAGADSVPVYHELLQRLRQKSRLWTYVPPSGKTTYDSVIPIIDGDSRVRRGEFVVGIEAKAVKDGTAIEGQFESLVSTGPGAFRHLRHLPLPSGGVRVTGSERLHLLPPVEAERVWTYLLANDAAMVPFIEAGLEGSTLPALAELLNDPKRLLRGWHRNAIERAVAVANENSLELDAIVLFAAFLRESQERSQGSTLSFVWQRLVEARGVGNDVIFVLDLNRYRIRTFDHEDRPRTINTAAAAVIGRFMHDAHVVRNATDRTDDIHTRHVAAAFLLNPAVGEYLTSLGFSVPQLRRDLLVFLKDSVPGIDEARWRKVLDVPKEAPKESPQPQPQQTSQPQSAPTPTPAPREFSIDTIVSRDTWTTDDHLGYGLYAQAITASILNGTAEPPLTIGIQAPWGQGKTSLMRMMQDELDPGAPHRDRVARSVATVTTAIETTYGRLLHWIRSPPEVSAGGMLNETRQKPPAHWPENKKKPVDSSDKRRRIPTVWFNPLYYRETQQVWAGMAHAILQQLSERFGDPIEREKFWFRLQQSRVNVDAIRRDVHHWLIMRFAPVGLLLVAAILLAVVGVTLAPASVAWLLHTFGAASIAAAAWQFIQERSRKIDRPFERYVTEPNYQSDLGPLHLIDHDLDRALRLLVGDKPIAVFIDDLDRCDPQTVNNVILAINQFLSLPRRNVFFILGMDMEMVAAALEQAQKEQFGGAVAQRRSFGWRFMEKFVQLPFFIPHLDAGVAQQFAESHLGGAHRAPVAAAAPPQIVEQAMEKLEKATTPSAVGEAMAEAAATLPPQEQATLQKEASNKVAELMKTNDSEEMKEIARIAVQDLDLNPRTIVRYFGLVRVLRNIQVSTGNVTSPEADRTLVLRAAHLLMNWPQFVQWLRNEPEIHTTAGAWKSTVEEVERLAGGQSMKRWQQGMAGLMRRDAAPPHLVDPSLYRFLRKIAAEPPGLKAMYDARMF